MITPMEERIGSVIKFFDKTSIATVKLDFGDHPVQKAIRGQFIGIKLSQTAKPFDLMYKVTG
jgi:hypothetical protein